MAATPPPNLPSLAPIDPSYFGFNEPPPQPPFMANPVPPQNPLHGQNHDRSSQGDALPPPPPPANTALAQLQQQLNIANIPIPTPFDDQGSNGRRSDDTGDGSRSEHGDSDSEEEERRASRSRWRPIAEDKSEPCQDELDYILSKAEHSAVDDVYWKEETFFDLDDPQIRPGESGIIDWQIDRFNGTEDNPNSELVMRSHIVRIGGYDWRIKLYPDGNESEYLSVYLECVTMEAAEFEESEEILKPPMPFLEGKERVRKRRTTAVQLCVIMYNPAEPRVYEYQMDAHQFDKKMPDYGWTRFTRYPKRDFHLRNHGQRQAMLRDDKLAFRAYIRVVNDPTNCLWSHGSHEQLYDDSLALTGLRPFQCLTPLFAAQIPLLHFAPFRDFIYKSPDTRIVFWFRNVLLKMMARRRSKYYGNIDVVPPTDAISWLNYCINSMRNESGPGTLDFLVNTFVPSDGAPVASNRLKTKSVRSIQEAIDAHPTVIAKPTLLTFELERHEFDRKTRKWEKLNNKVEMPEDITVSGTAYKLFSFTTHYGDLESRNFNIYVRPTGKDSMWYRYTNGRVACLTHKQAVGMHCGVDATAPPVKPKSRLSRHNLWARGVHGFDSQDEVAHVVMYIQSDFTSPNPLEETWDVPEHVRKGKPPPAPLKTDIYPPPDMTADCPPPTATTAAVAVADPIPDEEQVRKKSFDDAAGFSTPHSWPMDGEDVIMSDADDDSVESVSVGDRAIMTTGSEDLITQRTIDHLGRDYYHGKMYRRCYHGEGHLIAMNGDEYTGTFRDGEKHGHGKMIYGATGNIYEGEWVNGQHHGQGTLTEASTGNIFEGGWKEGKKHGVFVLKGTVTDEDKGCCSICYDREINTAFYDCGHVIACKECASMIQDCPVCRKRVLGRLQLFGVKMSFE